MLAAADAGFLFRAPPNVIAAFPQFPAFETYDDLRDAIIDALG
jgi:phosphoserine/homoserine phosphotransferase